MTGPLKNARRERYAQERAKGKPIGEAYVAAGFAANPGNAGRLDKEPDVAARVLELQQRAAEKVEITQGMVLKRWWDLATADPNELIQFRRTCCRHCHGARHAHQWIDAEEFAEALMLAKAAKAERLPTDAGGYGYDRTADPHPDCPKCAGEGRADIHGLDTRKLSGGAQLLYAGAKLTRDGFEIKLHDQGKALENVARHLGMFNDKLQLTGKDGKPIETITTVMTAKEAAERYREELG